MKHENTVRGAVLRTIWKNPLVSVVLVIMIAGAIVAGVMPPLVLERIVNRLADTRTVGLQLALLYFAVSAMAGLFDAGKESLITIFGQRVTHSIRSMMVAKLNRMPTGCFVKTDPGVTVSRIVNDVNAIDLLFASGIISMFVDACKILSILVVIFTRSLGLGLLLVVVTPLIFLLTRIVQKAILKAQLENRAAIGQTSQQIPETLNNIRAIHLLRREGYMKQKYAGAVEQSFRAMERSNFFNAVYSPIIQMMSALVIGVMMALTVQNGTMMELFGMTVGTAVAIIAYVGKIFEPLASIGMEIQNIQSAVAGVTRINEFMQEPEMPEETQKDAQPETDAMQICNLDFGYDPELPILRDFSLTVSKGEMVTIAGRTGAGKSTLFKLILGLYEPQSGSVLVYGRRPQQIPEKEKRSVFGYVEQQFRAVPGTIADQISLKDPEITEDAMEQALRLVGLWDDVCALKMGLQTQCTPDLFSQGQFQLLSIARAVVMDPQILLLDEITANLDSATEKRFLDALNAASKNRTVLSISHRLYEQKGGRIVMIGENP